MSNQLPDNDYHYNVFLSYTRNLVGDWFQDYFLELFKDYLDSALGYSPSIFIDAQSISAGDAWPVRIQKALAHSRCLVAVLSPAYFRSTWCMKECHVMLAREAAEGFGITGNGKGLVIPAIARDGEHHPKYIQDIQSVDFKRFVRKGSAFPNSPRYIEFQDEMEEWVKQVALAIRQAPPWNQSWTDKTTIEIPELEALRVTQPKIR